VRALLLGFGNVGRRLAEILVRRQEHPGLADLDVSVVGIVTARHGAAFDPSGLDLAAVLAAGRLPEQGSALAAARDLDYDVLVEMTPLDVAARGEPAISHVRAALERDRHAISCNKGPLAWAYRPLRDLARRQGRAFRHEATVMDGAPVFNLAEHGLRGNVILRLEGILNSTSNLVIGELERGSSLEAAVERARAAGVAEADPSLDLDGWDAAVKVAALANVLLDADLTPERVERERVADLRPERLRAAAARGLRTKMVCEVVRGEGGEVAARVRSREVPPGDPFSLVEGTGSILRIVTDILGTIALAEEHPDLSTTAYGVISDLYAIRDPQWAP
jgi:homoserine dehydrogenase